MDKIKKGLRYISASLGNIGKFGFKIVVIQIGAKLVPHLLPKKLRHSVNWLEDWNQTLIREYLITKFDSFITSYDTGNAAIKHHKEENKNIWLMWFQGEENAPELVKRCIENIRRMNSDKNVMVISQNNLNEFIDVPYKIMTLVNEGNMSPTHFSDYCRSVLLSEYGGVWIDATLFSVKTIPAEIFSREFYTIKDKSEQNFNVSVAHYRWNTFMMEAKVGESNVFNFVKDFLDNYWVHEDSSIDYLLIDYVLDIAYSKFDIYKQVIDSVDVNNEDTLWLESMLNRKFDKRDWKLQLEKRTIFYKLTYKNKHYRDFNGKATYYEKLLTNEL